jgi:CheY-like chemotaxis protein
MGLQFIWFHGLGQSRLDELVASLSLTRILVVDNDENILRVLTKLFTKENYSVLTARDGLEGLEMALGSQPDLIFLDLSVTGLSGLEVLQRVRASPRLGHIPVVILIGKARLADASLAR